MGSRRVLTDEQWSKIEALLPPVKGAMGRPQVPHRPVVEGIVFRYRAGIPWRDLPAEFGPWQTVWKRHHRWSADGTWDRVLAEVLADADAAGRVDRKVSADSTVVRAHQHATDVRRAPGPSSYLGSPSADVAGGATGGGSESQDLGRDRRGAPATDRARRPRAGPLPRWAEQQGASARRWTGSAAGRRGPARPGR